MAIKKEKVIICVVGNILPSQKDLGDGVSEIFLSSVRRWPKILYGGY
jgi:hypothetical protein